MFVVEYKSRKLQLHFARKCRNVEADIRNPLQTYEQFITIEKWLHECGHKNIIAVKTHKSSTFEITVPRIEMAKDFDLWNNKDLNKCLDAVAQLSAVKPDAPTGTVTREWRVLFYAYTATLTQKL